MPGNNGDCPNNASTATCSTKGRRRRGGVPQRKQPGGGVKKPKTTDERLAEAMDRLGGTTGTSTFISPVIFFCSPQSVLFGSLNDLTSSILSSLFNVARHPPSVLRLDARRTLFFLSFFHSCYTHSLSFRVPNFGSPPRLLCQYG